MSVADTPAMTPRFRRCVGLTIELWEGGDTTDTGGRTRYGISARAYPTEDIASLTIERARELYHRDYWERLQLDDLRDWRVAAKLFDIAVNLGVPAASLLAQRALALVGRTVPVDGKVGPMTRAALDSVAPVQMVAALCVEQGRHYERLIVRNATKYGAYERGWMRRAAWSPTGSE